MKAVCLNLGIYGRACCVSRVGLKGVVLRGTTVSFEPTQHERQQHDQRTSADLFCVAALDERTDGTGWSTSLNRRTASLALDLAPVLCLSSPSDIRAGTTRME